VTCGVDHNGGDIGGASRQTETFQLCIDACASWAGDDTCINVSYEPISKSCFLKRTLSANPNEDSGIYSATIDPLPPVIGKQWKCPDDGWLQYDGPDRGAFLIECNSNYAGTEISTSTVTNFEACILACDANADCVSAAYTDTSKSCKLQSTRSATNSGGTTWVATFRAYDPNGPAGPEVCGTHVDGSTGTAAGVQYNFHCAAFPRLEDLPTWTLDATTTPAAGSFEACASACLSGAADTHLGEGGSCTAFSWESEGKTCFVIGGYIGLLDGVASGFWTGVKSSAEGMMRMSLAGPAECTPETITLPDGSTLTTTCPK
jgi:hypothetical protein